MTAHRSYKNRRSTKSLEENLRLRLLQLQVAKEEINLAGASNYDTDMNNISADMRGLLQRIEALETPTNPPASD